MAGQVFIKPHANPVNQYIHMKRLYRQRRGPDSGPDKGVPATTYSDVDHLAKYWHGLFVRSERENYFLAHRDIASRRRWSAAKAKIDRQLAGADANALYPENQWFWGETFRVAAHLRTMKTTPTKFELLVESFDEAIEERKQQIAKAAKTAVAVGDKAVGAVKTGAIVVGGLLALGVAARVLWPRGERR